MSAPLRKLCLNAPPDIHKMIQERMQQLPYRSESDYLMALALHDCRFRHPVAHAFGGRILNQSQKRRDEDLAKIVLEFSEGAQPMTPEDLGRIASAFMTDYWKYVPVRLDKFKPEPTPEMPPPKKIRVKAGGNNRNPAKRKTARG